jgi:hypothetical protein
MTTAVSVASPAETVERVRNPAEEASSDFVWTLSFFSDKKRKKKQSYFER